MVTLVLVYIVLGNLPEQSLRLFIASIKKTMKLELRTSNAKIARNRRTKPCNMAIWLASHAAGLSLQ